VDEKKWGKNTGTQDVKKSDSIDKGKKKRENGKKRVW